MEESILKLASADNVQFGGVTLILIAMFFYFLKSLLNANQTLVDDNQKNIATFLDQINHQQTQNREALASNTLVLGKMNENLDKNNEINEKLVELLKSSKSK